MKKQEFLQEMLNSMKLVATKFSSNGGGSGTYAELMNFKGEKCGQIRIFVDRTAKAKKDRKLTIKLKGHYFDNHQEECYKHLLRYFSNKQEDNLMNSVNVKKSISVLCGLSVEEGTRLKLAHKAITITMKNEDCPWR